MQYHARWVAALRSGRVIKSIDDGGTEHLFAEVLEATRSGDEVVMVGWEPVSEQIAYAASLGGLRFRALAIDPVFVQVPPGAWVVPYIEIEGTVSFNQIQPHGMVHAVEYRISIDGAIVAAAKPKASEHAD